MSPAAEVFRIEDLRTYFETAKGVVRAVDGVSFSLARGAILGLVGESGSGKSVTGFSLMGLIDAPGRIVSGRIVLHGRELTGMPEKDWRQVRGNRVAMIFQDPMMALNPVLRIDTQMLETLRAHEAIGKRAALERCVVALEQVGMAAASSRLRAYPHQLSGGMRQRVAIAIALLLRPDVIICDEPTTALDVTLQGQILYEMQERCRTAGTALIWITHDLSVVAGLADTVAVMYAGRIVESGSTTQVLEQARHPYTRGLIDSTPAAARRQGLRPGRLAAIAGSPPSARNLPPGCAFRLRCPRVQEHCNREPPLEVDALGHGVRCFNPEPAGGRA